MLNATWKRLGILAIGLGLAVGGLTHASAASERNYAPYAQQRQAPDYPQSAYDRANNGRLAERLRQRTIIGTQGRASYTAPPINPNQDRYTYRTYTSPYR
jgi:hypothetical protein